jgi:polyisoprenoid-binding protein YceI
MKSSVLFFCLLFATLAFRPAALRYQIEPGASQLTWTGHAEVGSWAPSGTMRLRQGSFEYDGHVLRNGRFEVDMRTLAHTDAKLQEHLRSADFFAVEQYPTATFVLQEITQGQAAGQLTIKRVTKPIRFPVGVEQRPDGLHLTGTATVDRTAFGVTYNSTSFFQNLGDYAIRDDFQLKFDLVAKPMLPAGQARN